MLHHVRGCSLRRWAEWRVDPSHEPGGKLDPSPVSPWQVALEKQGPRDHGVGMLQASAVEDDAISRGMKLFRAARAGPGIPVAPRQSCADRLCPLLLLSRAKSEECGKWGVSHRADAVEHPSTAVSLHPYGTPRQGSLCHPNAACHWRVLQAQRCPATIHGQCHSLSACCLPPLFPVLLLLF